MRWVTRERPKVDRVACPWLIKRFVNPVAEILYVPADQVLATAERELPVYDALYAFCRAQDQGRS
jgi:hypothetical protein